MWFPSDMAVFDFTVRITRFGSVARVHSLVRAIAEIFDRLGIDHLLVDLNRDGDTAWSDVYVSDPIVIRGSCSLTCGLDEQVMAAAGRLLPEAKVLVEWYARDPANLVARRLDREVERVARMFGGLGRGAVPARVRLAILDPDAYTARYGNGGSRGGGVAGSDSFAVDALTDALCDVGADFGIDWLANRSSVVSALGELRESVAAEAGGAYDTVDGVEQSPWIAADELEFSAAGPIDPLAAETADHLNAVMFDAIRDALILAPPEVGVAVSWDRDADGVESVDLIESPEWLGELVVSAPDARAPYLLR